MYCDICGTDKEIWLKVIERGGREICHAYLCNDCVFDDLNYDAEQSLREYSEWCRANGREPPPDERIELS